jgi:branched-chain amino acid transport system substrate-binding protein
MRIKSIALVASATALAVMTATACSSSSKAPASGSSAGTTSTGTSSSSSSSGGGGTIKLGVITDSTGPASSGFTTTEKGIKAYVDYVNGAGGVNGQKLSYVMADSTSTPAGALTAAQRLVQSDKVFAIIDVSSDFYGAAPYTLKQKIPVVGGAFDGPEWAVKANTNLFAAPGVNDYTKVGSAQGEYMKARGVTSCAAIGYSSSPSAQLAAKAFMKSCQAAGLKAGYINEVAFGSTDMGAIALAIKQAGVDGLYLPVVPNTGFALAGAHQQIGVKLKSVLFATGYGGDLLQSSAAVTAAQGYEFSTSGNPVEADTPATQLEVKNLAAVGVSGPPTYAEQTAYLSMSAFVAGLKASGANPSRDTFMTAMRAVKGFDADGLLAPGKVDFDSYDSLSTGGCLFVAVLHASKFSVVPGTPLCGHILEGVTNS